MRKFLLIILVGSLLNGFLWWRGKSTTDATNVSPPENSVPAASLPLETMDLLTPELAKRAQDLAQELADIPSSRTGKAVSDPERVLAAAQALPIAGYVEFLRHCVNAAKEERTSGTCRPEEVFARLMERDAVAGMKWLLNEVNLSDSKWGLVGAQLLAYWTLEDPQNAREWMHSGHGELSAASAEWLDSAKCSYACAIAGRYPQESIQLLMKGRKPNIAYPPEEPYLVSSLDTEEKRGAFLTELNQADPKAPEHSALTTKALRTIRDAGGTLEEYFAACRSLNHASKETVALNAFRHFGDEPELLEQFK